jgi:ABC-type uncharacterized transport system substrate-binding protein
MAQIGHTSRVARCPLSGANRKTFTRSELTASEPAADDRGRSTSCPSLNGKTARPWRAIVVAARLVAEQTQSIPIVFLLSIDPVAEGLVASVSRPGGNITGFTQSDFDLGGKWLQLLKEIAPEITAAAIITSPLSPLAPLSDRSRAVGYMPSVEDAARSMGISVSVVEIRNPIEIEEKINALKPHQGVIFPPNSFIAAHRARIIELLTRFRVPGVYFARFFVFDGGLISYGIDQPDLFRQGGGYVDRILRGTNPADLPAQSPTKFELVVNLKTAKALGLTVPETLLARADEVIE